jgi:hypothetical protein
VRRSRCLASGAVPLKRVAVGFGLFLLVFLANGRALPEIDCVAAPYMAWSMVRSGTWDLHDYPELSRLLGGAVRERSDGGWYSIRPPGSAIAAIPFIAPVALTKPQPPSEEDMYQIGKLAAATCVSAAAMFLLLVLERLAPKAAWPATILFAFGTPLYSTASQALWMHGPAVFWLCAALYLLTRPGNCRLELRVLSGFALGMATLTRPAAAFFVIATVATLLLQRRWRGVCGLAIGGGVPAVLLFHYNMTHFGHPLLGGYEDDNWATTPPLWVGLSGLLIAPSRGLFVYAPALLLAPPGIKALSESVEPPRLGARALLFAWLAAATATLLFYARWYDWPGGWSYGPRLLSEAMPISCIFFALGYQKLADGSIRQVAAVALIAISIGVQILGVFGRENFAAWQERHTLADQGRSLFALEDTQIEVHARAFASRIVRVLTRSVQSRTELMEDRAPSATRASVSASSSYRLVSNRKRH